MTWNLPSPPGFQGLREDLPVTDYYRHLPHWRQKGATYFVTFRQADSLPQSKLRELTELRCRWERKLENTDCKRATRSPSVHHNESLEILSRRIIQKIERWLDQGMGSCVLRGSEPRGEVTHALHFLDGSRYELGAYIVMPNHVHAIVRPLEPDSNALESILQSRKRHTARRINRLLAQTGTFWQEESFDRIIRDEEHLWRCIQYIGRNPQLAGLTAEEYCRWIQPRWRDLGWRFEDE
jgi:putative transposase